MGFSLGDTSHVKGVPKHPYNLFKKGKYTWCLSAAKIKESSWTLHECTPHCSGAPGPAFGSSPKHNSGTKRVTCTPDCQASSRVKERIHIVQELQRCWKPEKSTDPGYTGPSCASPQKGQGQSYRQCPWWPRLHQMLLVCRSESRSFLFSGLFLCVEGVVVQVFNFPDDCQAINDDDFVLFFSLPFFAIILYSSRSPWAKDLAALSVESALPQHCSQKTFSTVSFTHILGDTRYVQKF